MDSILRGHRGHTDFAGVTCGVNCAELLNDTTVCILHKPRCAQRLVIAKLSAKLSCPKRSASSSTGTQFTCKRPTNLLRKSRQRKFLISASITASSNQCRPFSSEPPVPADLNTRPLRSRRPCTTPSVAIAAPFNGTCTGSSSARCSTSCLFSLPRPGTSLRYWKHPTSAVPTCWGEHYSCVYTRHLAGSRAAEPRIHI